MMKYEEISDEIDLLHNKNVLTEYDKEKLKFLVQELNNVIQEIEEDIEDLFDQ